MEDTTFEGERQFKDKMNYPHLLLRRINDIHDAIRVGRDGVTELTNLLSSLTKEINEPIKDEIIGITTELENEVKKVKETSYPDTWSYAHRHQVVESKCKDLNREAMQNIISVVINRLDIMGLLIEREREIPTGGEF